MHEAYLREGSFEPLDPLQDAASLEPDLAAEGLGHTNDDLGDGIDGEQVTEVVVEPIRGDGFERAGERCPGVRDRDPRVGLAYVEGSYPSAYL